MSRVQEIIEGLALITKYLHAGEYSEVCAEHDVLYYGHTMTAEDRMMTDDDVRKLTEMG